MVPVTCTALPASSLKSSPLLQSYQDAIWLFVKRRKSNTLEASVCGPLSEVVLLRMSSVVGLESVKSSAITLIVWVLTPDTTVTGLPVLSFTSTLLMRAASLQYIEYTAYLLREG